MEEEAVHLDYLGTSVAPQVFMFGQNPDGSGRIVMERLASVSDGDLLLLAVRTLEDKVWSRPAHPTWNRMQYWVDRFYMRFGFAVPNWVYDEPDCCIHGDPTLANMCFDGLTLRFIDPKPPGNGIPPFSSVDLGKIMQSWLGWEIALFSNAGRDPINHNEMLYLRDQIDPFLEIDDEMRLRRAAFWCMVHFLRIVHREGKSGLGYWAAANVRALQIAIGMEHETIGLGPGWDAGGDPAGEPTGLQVGGSSPA